MKIKSSNEYDKLKACIVGDATGAQFPKLDKIFNYNHQVTGWKDTPHPSGKFSNQVIEEANEDLEDLIHTLLNFGVKVFRPEELDHAQTVKTQDWETDGMYNYCPRDVLLVVDDLVIEAPMCYRARQMESNAYWKIKQNALTDDVKWIAAPRPRLLTSENFIVDNNVQLTEQEPIFDAANIIRHNNDILYLSSNTGNQSGARWLRNILGTEYKIHVLDNIYAYAHLDSTISIIRDGLVMLNASRITADNCPTLFDGWEKIWVDEVVPQTFYQYPYASKWIALNVLSLDPSTLIVDKNQKKLIRTLEQQFGITVIPLELRHSRTLGGGFHCVTLDLYRESTK